MGLLTRDQILSAEEPFEDVSVPEWGGSVRVRAFTVKEQAWLQSAGFKKDGDKLVPQEDISLKAISLACINEDGTKVFSETDIETLAGRSIVPIGTLWKAILRISKMDAASAKELEKN